jgi:hypothetical protein
MDIIQFDHVPTEQEIFDAAYGALLDQGCPSVNSGGGCVYRNNGYRCAIGWFIPDDVYESAMEDIGSSDSLIDTYGGEFGEEDHVLPVWFNDKRQLLDALQTAHDRPAPGGVTVSQYTDELRATWVSAFRDNMTELADRFGLTDREQS